MLQFFLFFPLSISLADSKYKGDLDYFPGLYLSPAQIFDYMNIFDPEQKIEYTADHKRKHVLFDNDVFDRIFGFDIDKVIGVHIPTEDEIKGEQANQEFLERKDKYESFLRRYFGISA